MRRTLYLSASVLTLVCSSALADSGIETVVVTAERRTEDLQKTAIAADVITADQLQNRGVVTIDSLQFLAPSVAVDNFGQGGDVNIRGIGKGEHNAQTGTGVITYRDDIPTFPGYILEEPYYDIQSIQILRGPQGTFVGENSTGGAVFVKTNDPIIDGGYTGYAMAQFGNYDDGAVQGAINIPISDTLAARVAVYDEARGSFFDIRDAYAPDACAGDKYSGCKAGYNPGDVRWSTIRFSLLWKPTDALTVLWKTDADYLDNGGYPADPFYDRDKIFPGTSLVNPYRTDLFHISANAPNQGLDRFVRSDLKIDYMLPDGIDIRSISGYQVASTFYKTDLDGTDYGNPEDSFAVNDFFQDAVNERVLSQEVDVISPSTGPITWVVGGFLQDNTYDYLKPFQFQIVTPPVSYLLQGPTPYWSMAAFAQVSWNITDALQLQVGARYSYNKEQNKDDDVNQFGTPIFVNQSTKSYNISYKVSLDYTINDDQFVYGFVSTGYKPGGLNVPVGFGQPAPFTSETVTSFETGWKATWLDGHLRSQLDAYYNKYDDFQVTIGYPLFPTFGFEVNDPNGSQIYGFEAETQAVFGDFAIDAGLGLMRSSLGKFFASDPRVTNNFLPCDPKTGPSGPSNPGCFDLDGHPQTYAPDVTYNFGAQYTFHVDDGGDTLTPRLSFAHVSGQWATLFDNPEQGDRLGARNLLGAQLGWQHGDYVFTLYGTNLLDQHYVAALNSGFDFAGPPRQYGIRLSTAF